MKSSFLQGVPEYSLVPGAKAIQLRVGTKKKKKKNHGGTLHFSPY